MTNIIENKNNYKCRICGNTFSSPRKRHYCFICSPESSRGNRAATITALRKAMKLEAVRRKGGKCQRCGYDKCIDALSFHHRDPKEKSFGLACNGNLHSWDDYWNEAKKCDLLCANCHAEEHSKINQD